MIKKVIYNLYEKLNERLTRNKINYLRKIKPSQKQRYYKLIKDFPEIYKKLSKYKMDKFMIPIWKNYNKTLEESFLSSDFSFLRNHIIRSSMFTTKKGRLLKDELNYLKEKLTKDKLKFLLEEEPIGNPILLNSEYLTSHNTIHHLYHLIFFLNNIKKPIGELHKIVEWGGGYGNFCRIFIKLKSSNCTYTIIDLPLFSCIQWIYLSSVFGKDKVNLIKDKKDKIIKGKINLLPVCLLNNFKLNADLFVSTWALSESSKYSQDYVKENNFLNAKHFLLAFQETSEIIPNAGRIIDLFKSKGLDIFPIKNINGSYYGFK